jgi:hypothetical protein
MTHDPPGTQKYGRELLLGGEKRNSVLDLDEVQRYGSDSYADINYVSIFGMRPAEWHAKGIRVLGRTAVECTRDALATAIGADIATAVGTAARANDMVVIDPFVGSGNTLYWMLHHLPGAHGVGFELDDLVFDLTRRNLSILGLPIDVVKADYASGLSDMKVTDDELVIAFLAPPWGDALDKSGSLDLRRTLPPIGDIVDRVIDRFANQLLIAIQVYENLDAAALAEVEARFEWSELRIYNFNVPGQNHGILLAGRHVGLPAE